MSVFFLLLGDLSLYDLNTHSGHDVEMTSAQLCTESLLEETEFNDSSTPNHLFSASSFFFLKCDHAAQITVQSFQDGS